MLSFWTDADTDTFRDVVVDSLAGLLPEVKFRSIKFEKGVPVLPAANELVVGMGQGPLDEIKKIGAVHKGKSLTSLREQPIAYRITPPTPITPDGTPAQAPASFGHWMFSYSPNSIYVEADKRSMIAWDARLAHRFYTTGSLEPELGTYAWVTDYDDVIQYINEKYDETGRPVSVSLDLETMGLVPWFEEKKIVSISLTVAPGVADLVYLLDKIWDDPVRLHKLLTQIRWICTSPKVALTGANLKFDILWMWIKWQIRPTNFKMDTLLVGSLLDENRSNSLKQHAREHTAMGGYELALERWMKSQTPKLDKGDMEKVPKDQLIRYAGPDTDVTQQVAIYQRKELQQEKRLQRFYVKVLHPAARAFEAIEHRGLVVDLDEFNRLEKELAGEQKRLMAAAIEMMPSRLRMKYAGNLDLRAAVLKDFFFTDYGLNLKPRMFTEKTEAIKTDKAHFMMFDDVPEAAAFLDVYRQYLSASKTMQTYVHGFLNHLRPDGRFHPTYMLFNGSAFEGDDDDGGTDTGRTSAVDPAVQTIPKHTAWAKKLRKCYPAPPGMRFFQADFSQGELRIAACVAEEPNMIAAYQNKQDLHCVTGASLAGYELGEFMDLQLPDGVKYDAATKEQKIAYELFAKFRQRAKPANFGLLYGMQSEGFREYARVNYKVNMTSEEAAGVRDAFFALYAMLPVWHQNAAAEAAQYGYVVNPLGRIAHLPLIKSKIWKIKSKAERKAINSPIQSCLSDLCAWAIAFLEERYASDGLWIAGMTHDSIYGYYPEEDPQLWLGRIVEVMQTLPYREVLDWHPVLDFPADIEEGPNLAQLDKFKIAA